MKLAKSRLDVGLSTNNAEELLPFWQNEIGVPYDHLLKIKRGHQQHRHDALGSVLKINSYLDPLPETPAAGYRELLIASDGREVRMADPDGNAVSLVAPGTFGVTQIAVRLVVRDLAAHRKFYTEAFGFPEKPYEHGVAFQVEESLILLEESADAPSDAAYDGKGWRYITLQVFKVDEDHERVLQAGGREALAPVTLGSTARISMVRDPDGNWIELSQRASIVGSLD
jgi:predicted enzyme related to lactoylglutathione lyase